MMEYKNTSDSTTVNLLSSLKIAAPCDVPWQSMTGDEHVRLCSQCNKNVYNISQMSKKEANEFLRLTDHNACVNFFQRFDGTIITDNCPRGLRKLRDRYRKIAASISSLLAITHTFLLSAIAAEPNKQSGNPAPMQMRGEPEIVPLGGKPTVQPLGGSPVVSGGEPSSIVNYRQYIKNSLIEAMPKNVSYGNAAISLSINKQGEIVDLRFINKSPEVSTDRLILSTVKQLKFKPLPAGSAPIVMTYFECRCAQ